MGRRSHLLFLRGGGGEFDTAVLSKKNLQILDLQWLASMHLGRDFLLLNDCVSLVQRSCLIKEPNVNDQGFISYLNDQEYLVVIYVRTSHSLGSKTNDYP